MYINIYTMETYAHRIDSNIAAINRQPNNSCHSGR